MSAIQPTVGRKVYFQPGQDQQSNGGGKIVQRDGQPIDATINYVWSDTMINVTLKDHDGNDHFVTSVRLRQDGEEAPQGGYAYWMPYQVGQAKAAVRDVELVKLADNGVPVGAESNTTSD